MKLELKTLFALAEPPASEDVWIVFDDLYAYVASKSKISRIDRRFDFGGTAVVLAEGLGAIHSLYAEEDGLYLLKDSAKDGPSLLRSRDHGSTFQPIDQGLVLKKGNDKQTLVPTRMIRTSRLRET
ncbi:hypothetical protein [Bradyrhizobium icense]|uniref:hypothetical protein n=1 Tax=Bradyrhizobium icense TaxID=1274631 RepID=UPI0012EA59D1|nr:hypothetical protein [Bradyrhizobium icense]